MDKGKRGGCPVGVNIVETEQSVNSCNCASFRDHAVLEEDHIPSLQNHKQMLEQEQCFLDIVLVFLLYFFLFSLLLLLSLFFFVMQCRIIPVWSSSRRVWFTAARAENVSHAFSCQAVP